MLASVENKSGCVVIGIGINVNSDWSALEDRCSLASFAMGSLNRNEIISDIIQSVEATLSDIKHGRIDMDHWHQVAAFINEPISIIDNQLKVDGYFMGIDDSGAALIKKDGQILQIINGHSMALKNQ